MKALFLILLAIPLLACASASPDSESATAPASDLQVSGAAMGPALRWEKRCMQILKNPANNRFYISNLTTVTIVIELNAENDNCAMLQAGEDWIAVKKDGADTVYFFDVSRIQILGSFEDETLMLAN